MNLKTKLAATLLMVGSASMAQATSYSVEGLFAEPMAMQGNSGGTLFSGTFDWDTSLDFATNSSNMGLTGIMNSSMMNTTANQNLNLTNYISADTSLNGTVVTASVFLNNSADVFVQGGHDATFGAFGMATMQGMAPSPNPANGYFSFSFDTAGGMVAATGLTSTMQYGDCTDDGMMNSMCMTGFGVPTDMNVADGESPDLTVNGTMGGYAQSLTISEVSAVPVPAAAWLFGGALVSLFGANRRKNVLPA